jgi:hypothetical protein
MGITGYDLKMLNVNVLNIYSFSAAARPVENMMPPPPAPVAVVNPAPISTGGPGGTVTRQSSMNPQGVLSFFSSWL